MSIKIVKNFTMRGIVENKVSQVYKPRFDAALSDEVTRIVIRTRSGKDRHGVKFDGYTDEYRRRKLGAGRATKSRQSRKTGLVTQIGGGLKVDLTLTGQMLSSIRYLIEQKGTKLFGEIFFSNALAANKAKGNIENGRDFFGIDKAGLRRIVQKLNYKR